MTEFPGSDLVERINRHRASQGLPPIFPTESEPEPTPDDEIVWPAEVLLPDLGSDYSDATQRLNELYDSITIWEVYKRLLPNKPHNPYHPTRDFNVACPHEEGKRSLSMWINDQKGMFFCAHTWTGGNKMGLYCEIRGLNNSREYFHNLKVLMVWEFRGINPYEVKK